VENIRQNVAKFLREYNMYHADIDMEKTCRTFLQEMDRGLAGRKSSLAMLPTYLDIERKIPRNKPVIVMDAGGTNFRVATVAFAPGGTASVEDFRVYPMPGIKKEVGKEEFFGTMAGYVEDVLDESRNVGFCFSYPIEMFPNKDGRALYFSKEIKAPEAAGQMIGQNLNLAIRRMGHEGRKKVILLNDTVATLLAGRGSAVGRRYDSYIGFILGTGTNTSYVEQNREITKAKDLDRAKSQIVNVESGGFGKAPRGPIDLEFDAASVSPGINVFEKMISGAYLGPLCLKTVHVAAKDGLFSRAAAKKLKAVRQASTKDISDFLTAPEEGDNPLAQALAGQREDEVVALYHLVDALVERAAKLTAINLSSAAIKCGKGQNPCRPVCIVAEGTTFYHLRSLKHKIECYLTQYLQNNKGIYYDIINVDNATLIGAAIAGLTN
jgi:hexokinase